MNRAISVAALAALTLTAVPTDALACGGTAPAPTCAKTLSLGKGIRQVFVAGNTPTTVPVPRGIFLGMAPPAGSPRSLCPAGPATGSITLTATCTVPGTGATTTVPVALTPNAWNIGVTNLVFPAGPARQCRIVGSVTSTCTLTNGVPLTATARGDAQVCFVEPSPTDPGLPRLDFRHIDIDNTLVDLDEVVGQAHPGDPITRWYRITNHDGVNGVDVRIDVDSEQTARLPDPGTPQPLATRSGANIFAISDPGVADDFPIAFRADLACNDCLPLPPDPLASIDPTIGQTLRLEPHESTVVGVVSRSWGMCADGSCGESTVFAEGRYDDGTSATGCATGVHAVDDTVAPRFDWPDSGATASYTGGTAALDLALRPTPNDTWQLQSFIESQVRIDGVDAFPLGPPQGELINQDWGRLHETLQVPPGVQGRTVEYTGFLSYFPALPTGGPQARVVDMFAVPGAPAGFETISPMGMGFMDLVDPSGLSGTVELFSQLSMWGVTPGGEYVPVEIVAMNLAPAGPGYQVSAQGFLPPGAPAISELRVLNDQRAFAYFALPPQCEEDLVLIVDDMSPGEVTNLYVEGADPNQRVQILRSEVGPGAGPCLPGFTQPCAGILSPIATLSGRADARGIVDLRPTVPRGAPAGATVWWQAVALDGANSRVSNVTEVTLTP